MQGSAIGMGWLPAILSQGQQGFCILSGVALSVSGSMAELQAMNMNWCVGEQALLINPTGLIQIYTS